MTFDDWARAHPAAAADLVRVLQPGVTPPDGDGGAESRAQQQVRMAAARAGWALWRNNVGATPTREQHVCPACRFRFEVTRPPLRYGLCNDSAKLNAALKSSDLIGIKPVRIGPEHVGQVIGQFVAVEVKRPGWAWSGNAREQAQAAYLALVHRLGGAGGFSTGGLP